MTDVHTKAVRSYNMSRIKSKDTKPEMLVRKFLFFNGFRYRLHDKKLPGTPDIVLTKYKTVIFVNGCFWHGHQGCRYFVIPKTRSEWWTTKIERNKILDKQNIEKLEAVGWNVINIFQCDLKKITINLTLSNLIINLEKQMK